MSLAAVDSELGRAQELGPEFAPSSYERALLLLESIINKERGPRRRELARLYEVIAQQLSGDKQYDVSLKQLRQYFEPFNNRVAQERGLT